MNVLIVEDDLSVASFLKGVIEEWHHTAEVVGTGSNAIKKIRERRFDLVLLDIYLPDVMGYDLIPQFKEIWPEIRIVTMTGYNTRELEMKIRQQGVMYYMVKPFSIKAIKDILNHISEKMRS